MSNHEEHFEAFLTYAFIPLLLIGMILVIILLSMLGWDMLKDRFPKHTGKVITDLKHVYITPIHNDDVETLQTQGWKIVDKHPTNPDYTLMTKPVED